jgi:hypothetical protein
MSPSIVLSAGTAPNFQAECGGWFGVTTVSWPILWYIASQYLVDTNYTIEEDVIVPVHVRKELHIGEPAGEAGA